LTPFPRCLRPKARTAVWGPGHQGQEKDQDPGLKGFKLTCLAASLISPAECCLRRVFAGVTTAFEPISLIDLAYKEAFWFCTSLLLEGIDGVCLRLCNLASVMIILLLAGPLGPARWRVCARGVPSPWAARQTERERHSQREEQRPGPRPRRNAPPLGKAGVRRQGARLPASQATGQSGNQPVRQPASQATSQSGCQAAGQAARWLGCRAGSQVNQDSSIQPANQSEVSSPPPAASWCAGRPIRNGAMA